ncbi:MAG: ATP-binding protein [Bacteroidota bacterium]|nr:ATP-binding protein [Bacteroidota bacterium]
MPSRSSGSLLLFIDLVVFVLCVVGVEQIRQKAWIGVDLHSLTPPSSVRTADTTRGDGSIGACGIVLRVRHVTVANAPLRIGDILVSIAEYPIRNPEDPEQILDQFAVGSVQPVVLRRGDATITTPVTLTPYYSRPDVIVIAAAIGVFFFMGLLVVWLRPEDPVSRPFHHLVVGVACLMAFTMGRYTLEPHGLGHVLRALYPLANAFVGSALVLFALTFPHGGVRSRGLAMLLYLIAAAVGTWGFIASMRATVPFDLAFAPVFYAAMTAGKALLGAGTLASVVIFAVRFARERDSGYRRQIAWAMTGTSIGTAAFVAWQLSTSGFVQSLLPAGVTDLFGDVHMDEIVLNAALLATAGFMVIGIIRYRMFDIELLLKRGTVYALLLVVLILVNAVILSFWIHRTGSEREGTFFLIMAALSIDMLLFIPTRDLIQRAIDRWFFRVEYNFREALRRISDEVLSSVQAEDAARWIVDGLDALLQPTGVMVLAVRNENGHRAHSTLQVLGQRGFRRWKYASLTVHRARLRALPPGPLAFDDVLEPGTTASHAENAVARRFRIRVVFPIRAEDGAILGLLVLGERKSGARYTLEDVDLMHAVTTQAALQFERFLLQQHLLLQRHEADRLRKLNRMKSFFVSGVSHDLKTPLTSINMFAELLESQLPARNDDARTSLGIIQGECARLARLIDNVLDFTRIERGTVAYHMAREDLTLLAARTRDTMAYQLRIGGYVCRLEPCADPLPVMVDADAVQQAVGNLLGNAMKYSGESREIALRTAREHGHAVLAVRDHGIGIAPEELPQLFEPFFRSSSDRVQKLGGVGLGLALVKHIVDAHGGRVTVERHPDGGSTFRLSFPLLEHA